MWANFICEDVYGFANRDCEGTEQLRKVFFRKNRMQVWANFICEDVYGFANCDCE